VLFPVHRRHHFRLRASPDVSRYRAHAARALVLRLRLICILLEIAVLCSSACAYTRITNVLGLMPKWPSMPVSYWINAQGSPQIQNGSDFAAVQAAFQTWQNVPTANIQFNYKGTTPVATAGFDGMNLVTFADSSIPLGTTTIAVTLSYYGTVTGSDGTAQFGTEEADIVFNTTFPFSTSDETGKYDVQGVLTHEIGHFLGLDHAAMVSSVMVPYAAASQLDQRTLSYDDIAGVMEIYPKNLPPVGKVKGSIQSGTGPVFGANVVAVDSTGTAVVSTLSQVDGTYTLQFVPPGTYRVYAEPLDNPVTPANVSVFYQRAQTNFGTTYFGNVATLVGARTVTVTANGTATADIQTLPQSLTYLNLTRPAFGVRLGRGISGVLTVGGYDITSGVSFNASSPGIFLGTPSGACSTGITTNCFGGQISIVGPTSARMDISIDPSTSVGPKYVEVHRNGDTSILSGGVVVTDPSPANISITPTLGTVAGGTAVTVMGSNFRSGAQVYFGGLAAMSVNVMDSGTIQATTPANVPAFTNVVVMNVDGTWGAGAGIYGFVTAPPVINTASPLSGPPGTVVTVQGVNFGTVLPNVQVTFGGAAARIISITDSSLQAIVPYGAVSGSVFVTVVGQPATGPNFTVTGAAPSTNPASNIYNFKDASFNAGGLPLLFPDWDDSVVYQPVPFTFSLFNDIFEAGEQLSISTNGWMSLAGESNPAPQNSMLPAASVTLTKGGTGVVPRALIAPFWGDLILEGASSVSSRIVGAAPNRQFIVEWSKVTILDSSGNNQNSTITFEAVLFEGSNDIQLMYGDLSGPLSDGSSSTVGMQDLSRTTAVLTSFDQPLLKSRTLMTYHYQNGNYIATAGAMDPTPPGTPAVTDEGPSTSNRTQLAASWNAVVPPSGIGSFQYGIGTTPGGTDVIPFTSTTQNSAVVTGLNLSANTTYYFAVQAISGAGIVSGVGVSGGVRYNPLFQPQVKFIPSAPQGNGTFSGIALLAPQGSAESVVLRAFDSSGAYILGPGIFNPITLPLNAGQQSAKLVSELFGLPSFDGWIQVEASAPGLGVFTATGPTDLSAMDGSNSRDPSTDFVLFHAGATAVFVNPSPRTANVQVTNLSTGTVQALTMPPTSRNVMTLAAASRFQSSEALAAIEQVSSPGRLTINSAVPVSAAHSSLVFPDAVTGNGYASTLTLVNVTGTQQIATFRFGGAFFGETISANSVVQVPLTTASVASGAVYVLSTSLSTTLSGPSGPALLGVLDIDNGSDPVTIGAPSASTDFWFPQVANGDGLFTGLALASGSAASNITVEVYGSNGGTPKSATITLAANQQTAQLVNQIVPSSANQVGGYIHVHSDQPIWAWEIYGSDRIQASGPPL
jgi:hypothetical protein